MWVATLEYLEGDGYYEHWEVSAVYGPFSSEEEARQWGAAKSVGDDLCKSGNKVYGALEVHNPV